MLLSTPLQKIPSLKSFHLTRLKRLGIITVGDLLRHFPSRYDDFSLCIPIAHIQANTLCTIQGTVKNFRSKQTKFKRLLISEAFIKDETGTVHAIWFGRKYLDALLTPGREVRLSGKVVLKNKELVFQSPECEIASRDATHTAGRIAVYPETEGLTSKWLRWQIQRLLPHTEFPEDVLPQEIRERLHLPSAKQAFLYIHSPKSKEHALLAQKYFAFEEMFLLQLFSLRQKQKQSEESSLAVSPDDASLSQFINSLPFALTRDQQTAVIKILEDMGKSHPMNRLLNGDVGSGKTVVATIAARHIAQAGYQTALLAPTEVLALQHFSSLSSLLQNESLSVGLFTHSYQYIRYAKQSKVETLNHTKMKNALTSGMVDICIGTHALIQKDITFKNLALVIIDEQHRFGVTQRAHLQNISKNINDGFKQHIPHLLSMTATPIPRTLSLTVFGNLDISLLETMPKNRLPIRTKIVEASDRENAYTFIRSQIASGRQTYIILPFVEESEAFENVKAAVTEHERLQKDIFPHLTLGLMHGRLKSAEKESVMRDFKEGKIDILVSTSVVEVGVDVPNATSMIIENADRFGLSQLHQFRGRIGRGTEQSYCFLFASEDAENPSKRMRILEKTNSGFEIAEEDLKLRGPGQFLGARQSGLPDVAMESMGNMRLIAVAQKEAQALLEKDPDLDHFPALQQSLQIFDENVHME